MTCLYYHFFTIISIVTVLIFGIILIVKAFQKEECPTIKYNNQVIKNDNTQGDVSDIFSKMFSIDPSDNRLVI